MTTIVVADDHPMIRQGVRALLEAEPDWSVVGEAADGPSAVELVEQVRPDVAIIDVMMPGISGLEVVRRVKRIAPQTVVVVLSMHADEPYVVEALRGGAQGYVLKGTNITVLVEALREVLAGRRYLSPPLSEGTIDAYRQRATASGRPIDAYDMLTPRERRVLRLLAEGCTTAEIAERLSIGVRAAETHRATVMRKLGLRDERDLRQYLVERGFVDRS
jgi:DNA-binding NarL/FixJ family response regulator